jgi:hypothetical protein
MHRLLLYLAVLTVLPLHAQTDRPSYVDLRWDENWTYLRDHSRRSDYADPLKYIALPHNGWYVSIGGESRTRYEFFRSFNFGSTPDSPYGFMIQRFLLHADLHLGQRVRVFVQAQSGLEGGRVGGPRPTDRDELEIHQGFIDLATAEDPHRAVTVRLGRQELEFGSGHYFSASEVFNVRRSFDAARVFWQQGRWTWNALVARPVEINPGVFDDSPDHRQSVWATGFFGPNPMIRKGNVSAYYIGYARKVGVFNKGTGQETRHTLGTRWSGTAGAFDYNYEAMFQTGYFAQGNILALAVAMETGFTPPDWKFATRFALRSDTASGDRNKNSHTLGTFNPLFPTTSYSGKIGLVGASNVIDVTPVVRFRFTPRITFTPEMSFFWRESLADGIYSVLTVPLRVAGMSNARYVGAQLSVPLQMQLDRHFTWTVMAARFYAGAYIKETPPIGRSVTYFTNFVTYRF